MPFNNIRAIKKTSTWIEGRCALRFFCEHFKEYAIGMYP